MKPVPMEIDDYGTLSADPLPYARNYQLEALEAAIKRNTIVFLETGKTLIAIMLLRGYSYLLRKPSPFFAVFLVPQVVLVQQVYTCEIESVLAEYIPTSTPKYRTYRSKEIPSASYTCLIN